MEDHIKFDDMKFVTKKWGYEQWVVNNEKYCGKILFIKKGCFTSWHFHKEKTETMLLIKGKVLLTYNKGQSNKFLVLDEREAFHVNPETKHQIEAIEDSYLIEFSTQHFDSDSHRITKGTV